MKITFSVNCYTQEKGVIELEKPTPICSEEAFDYLKDCVHHHLGKDYSLSQDELDVFEKYGALTIRDKNLYYTFSWE